MAMNFDPMGLPPVPRPSTGFDPTQNRKPRMGGDQQIPPTPEGVLNQIAQRMPQPQGNAYGFYQRQQGLMPVNPQRPPMPSGPAPSAAFPPPQPPPPQSQMHMMQPPQQGVPSLDSLMLNRELGGRRMPPYPNRGAF